jgi:uncharacterized Zn finger protein
VQTSFLPTIDERDILLHVGEAAADRGRMYFEQGRLFDERTLPGELRGYCAGGQVNPYLVRVVFHADTIVESRCTCPIGHRCKHVAALLYGWLEEPHRFASTPGWRERLLGLAPGQLVAIVEALIAHDVHMEQIFETALGALEPSAPVDGHAQAQEQDLISTLLRLGERKEAVLEMRRAPLWQLPAIADIFVDCGEDELAMLLVRERLTEGPQDEPLLSWLIDYYDERGRFEDAFQWARRRFQHRPTSDHYIETQRFARAIGIWASVRTPLLNQLRRSSADEHLLALLAEGQLDEALEHWQRGREKGFPWQVSTTTALATSYELTRPALAIALWLDAIDTLIAKRTRAAYRQAAADLEQVRRLHIQSAEGQSWHEIIEELVRSHQRRWALLEELDKAGLLPGDEPSMTRRPSDEAR